LGGWEGRGRKEERREGKVRRGKGRGWEGMGGETDFN
jgi:hypothetical protein